MTTLNITISSLIGIAFVLISGYRTLFVHKIPKTFLVGDVLIGCLIGVAGFAILTLAFKR